MKKRSILSMSLILLLALGFNASSRETHIAKDTLLYVRDHAGENFLVLKVDACVLGNRGELTCSMAPLQKAQPLQVGPEGGFFAGLAYPQR